MSKSIISKSESEYSKNGLESNSILGYYKSDSSHIDVMCCVCQTFQASHFHSIMCTF